MNNSVSKLGKFLKFRLELLIKIEELFFEVLG